MSKLSINYAAHEGVGELIDILTYCAEGISLGFDQWEKSHTMGPGLYFVVIADHRYGSYADPMGANEWPLENYRQVEQDGKFYETARDVAFENDGAVVISVDGVVQEQMVRVRNLNEEELQSDSLPKTEFADWMGARHMSALETSLREEVVATVTLSEETGRVSIFNNGNVRTRRRDELGETWPQK